MYFSHFGVFLISVKPLTTENTENKTTPKICKTTVLVVLLIVVDLHAQLVHMLKRRLLQCKSRSPVVSCKAMRLDLHFPVDRN